MGSSSGLSPRRPVQKTLMNLAIAMACRLTSVLCLGIIQGGAASVAQLPGPAGSSTPADAPAPNKIDSTEAVSGPALRLRQTPRIRVPPELGGTVTVPCDLTAVVACKLSPQSVTFTAAGKPVIAAATLQALQCSCAVPPADAASSAALAFSADNATWPKKGSAVVDYYATWSPSLGKRPYLSSDTTAQVVLVTDPAAVSLYTNDDLSVEFPHRILIVQ